MIFEKGDIVLVRKKILVEATNIHPKFKQISGTIMKCDVKEREDEKGHLFDNYNCKLIWRRE